MKVFKLGIVFISLNAAFAGNSSASLGEAFQRINAYLPNLRWAIRQTWPRYLLGTQVNPRGLTISLGRMSSGYVRVMRRLLASQHLPLERKAAVANLFSMPPESLWTALLSTEYIQERDFLTAQLGVPIERLRAFNRAFNFQESTDLAVALLMKGLGDDASAIVYAAAPTHLPEAIKIDVVWTQFSRVVPRAMGQFLMSSSEARILRLGLVDLKYRIPGPPPGRPKLDGSVRYVVSSLTDWMGEEQRRTSLSHH